MCGNLVENSLDSHKPVDKKTPQDASLGGFQRFKHPPQGTPATREAVKGGSPCTGNRETSSLADLD